MSDIAYINPQILSWAIARSRMDRGQIAKKIGTSEEALESWESEPGSHPPFKKARKLADVLRVPFGYFYLPKPPSDELPIPDRRTRHPNRRPSLDFVDLLNDVLLKQDWYRDHLKATGRTKVRFVGAFSVVDSKVEDVAADIRSTLGITKELRASVASIHEYMNTLVRAAEDNGVLVMRTSVVGHSTNRRVSPDEVQGFAVADPVAPVVFVNSADAKGAQVFTLAHELAHIWVGQSGIDDARPDTKGNGAEGFCNSVAASVLVPANEFAAAWDNTVAVDRIRRLSRQFWVSSMVIIRRALEIGKIAKAEYDRLMAEAARLSKPAKKSSGGDFYRSLVVRMSAKFTSAVIGEVNRNTMQVRQAASLLGVSGKTLLKVAEMAR